MSDEEMEDIKNKDREWRLNYPRSSVPYMSMSKMNVKDNHMDEEFSRANVEMSAAVLEKPPKIE